MADDPLVQAVARLTKMASDPNNRWRIACRPNCATNEYLNRGACDCGGQELWEAIPRALAALHAAREDADDKRWDEVIANANAEKIQRYAERIRAEVAARAANQEGT